MQLRLRNIYSWTTPLLFHSMFSHSFHQYIVRRTFQSMTLDTIRNHILPDIRAKQESIQIMPFSPPPHCRTCKHFKPVIFKGEFEIGRYYGTCRLFTMRDPITNLHEPLFAHEARKSDAYCGKNGRYYSLHPVFRK